MIYLVVFVILLWLSFRYDIVGNTKHRDFWYYVMLLVFILVAGLRWRLGIDTPPYIYNFYHEYPYLGDFSFEDYSITESPLYVLLNSFVKSIGGRFYIVQLIHAAIINVLIFYYIKKNSNYLFTCILLYALTCYFAYNMEIMRGSLSIAICLYANDYVLERKWLKGYLLYSIAFLFHPQTIVLFVLPIFFFLKFNKIGLLVCLGAFVVGKIIMNVLGDYIFLFEANEALSDKVSGYVDSDTYSIQGGNIKFYLVNIFPILFYVIASFLYVKAKRTNTTLLKYEPLVLLGICFIMMRMNLEIAYRYIDYYMIYFVLAISEFFVGMIRRESNLKISVAYVRSCMVFLPFFFIFVGLGFFWDKGQGFRYIPYSSVIEKTIDRRRELKYVEMNAIKNFYPRPNVNEY